MPLLHIKAFRAKFWLPTVLFALHKLYPLKIELQFKNCICDYHHLLLQLAIVFSNVSDFVLLTYSIDK